MVYRQAVALLVVCIIITSPCCIGVLHGEVTGERFQRLLLSLSDDALGVKQMQDYVDNVVQDKVTKLDGGGLMKEISRDLRDKFKSAMDVVKRLKRHYEKSFPVLRAENVYYDCCNPPSNIPFYYDNRLKGKVNTDSLCYVGVGAKDKSTKHLDHSFVNVMKDNYDKQRNIKWQYIGTEEGIQHIYPAPFDCNKVVNTNAYDPRFRPWYVETATPIPKDVVIVIDNSLSMNDITESRTLMHIAKEAAKTVVETLNPNDKVGVIAFSDIAETPTSPGVPGCYSSTLAQGTPENKRNINKLIDKIKQAGGTKYVAALQLAFHLLSATVNDTKNEDRDATILFLTDGKPEESATEILDTIRDCNSKLGNKVTMLTFGIGEAFHQDDDNIQLLKDIAEQKGANISYGTIRKGIFTPVQNPNNLRRAMGTYYAFFSQASKDTVISVPYFDTFGLGLITSICSPLMNPPRSLRGIACVDISLSQLLGAAAYFRPSELSYAFIVNNHGRLVTHPLLQQLYDYSDEPLFVDMLEIERAPEAKDILKSMLSGGSGEKTFASKRIISRGDSIHNGVDSRSVMSGYFWEQIQYTNYSVCVVVGMDDVRIQYIDFESLTSFLYHRLDLVTPSRACNNFGQLAVLESAIKFTTRAFVRPSAYFDTQENRTIVLRYADMMLRDAPYDATFRDGVKETVAVTKKADDIWRSEKIMKSTSKYSIWKYIGTQNGVHRTFPGHPLYIQYDPTVRPWYKKAMSNKGRNALSPPYEDAGGAGVVLTLSKTIFQKSNKSHSSRDPILGVMGLDFSISRFYTLIVDSFPECETNYTTCFVMDNSGYLVFHRDFKAKENRKTRVKHVHIIEKEPDVAYDLIDKGYMKKEACIKFSTIRNQFFWRVEIASASPVKVINAQLIYELYDVQGSNVFFGKKISDRSRPSDQCNCISKQPPGEKFIQCKSTSPSVCECPCSSPTSYNYCDNIFRRNGDGWPVCFPDGPPTTNTKTLGNDIASTLPACFDFKCYSLTSRRMCSNVVGCIWCDRDSLWRAIERDHSFCTVYSNCSNGIEKQKSEDGQWSLWGPWAGSDCSTTCGNGTMHGKRSRLCNNPPKRHRGGHCPGDDVTTNTSLQCVGDCTGYILPLAIAGPIVVIVVTAIMGFVCWKKCRGLKATHAPMGQPFHAAYASSSDQSSSADQSSGSSGNTLMPSHTNIPNHVSFGPRHNPVYESGDGDIGDTFFNIGPQPPTRSPGVFHIHTADYINPRIPFEVSQ